MQPFGRRVPSPTVIRRCAAECKGTRNGRKPATVRGRSGGRKAFGLRGAGRELLRQLGMPLTSVVGDRPLRRHAFFRCSAEVVTMI